MTAAVHDPDLVAEAAAKIGSANLVLAIDARARGDTPSGGVRGPERWEVCTHGGRRPTGIDAVDWAARMAEAGAGEILLTSMDRDGTKSGYDLPLLRAVADRVSIPCDRLGGRRQRGRPGGSARRPVPRRATPGRASRRPSSTSARPRWARSSGRCSSAASRCGRHLPEQRG